jgi:hypothetical protein
VLVSYCPPWRNLAELGDVLVAALGFRWRKASSSTRSGLGQDWEGREIGAGTTGRAALEGGSQPARDIVPKAKCASLHQRIPPGTFREAGFEGTKLAIRHRRVDRLGPTPLKNTGDGGTFSHAGGALIRIPTLTVAPWALDRSSGRLYNWFFHSRGRWDS